MIREGHDTALPRIERARIHLAEGEIAGAVRDYQKAVEEDPEAMDSELAERLGITEEPKGIGAGIIEGRVRA